MAHRSARIPGIVGLSGAIGLSFTVTACNDGEIADDGDVGDDVGETNYNDDGPYCVTGACCYNSPGYCYSDEGYNDSYSDEGYNDSFDEGYNDSYSDEGYDEGYNPTTTFPDTDTLTTITTIDSESDTLDTTTTGTESDTDSTTGTGTSTGDTDSTTSTDTTDSSSSDTGDSSSSTGEPEDAFPPAGLFGDDVFGVQEQDLIGTWSLQWAPDGSTGDSILTIDESGNFLWRETSADCSVDTLATGFVWVEPGTLVMHVDTWERQLPWDTLGVLGEEFQAPFRLRMTYALLGPNLGLAAPERLTTDPYTGRAQLQTDIKGVYIAGTYSGEAELIAVRAGEQQAELIVRDRFISTLDVEPGVNPESTGIAVHDQIYWTEEPPIAGPTIYEASNWTCLDGCPQPAGATLINGGNLYAYGPYAAYQRLMVFATGRSFRRDVDTDCP